jgi:hypothetical protein
MPDYYENFFQTALDENLDKIQNEFREKGAEHGWPESLTNSININVNDGNLSLDYDERLDTMISDFEYGTPLQPARAAIRNFTANVGDSIEEIFAKYGVDAIFSRGILP